MTDKRPTGHALKTESAPEIAARRSSKSILLVEDDAGLCSLMTAFFAHHGFRVESAHDGPRGLVRAIEGGFDMVILDVMLPGLDGFEVLRQLRKRSATPVIMLTARIAERDRIAGLDAGADDYLPKPFGPEELLARIRAVLRRTGRESGRQALIAEGGLALNPGSREVTYEGKQLALTAIEFDILELLMRSAGRVVSRDELTTVLYHRQSAPWERTLDVHVSHLRRKLLSIGISPIRTIRLVGYQFSTHPSESL